MSKNVILGVTGGIAAYKSAEIASRLKKSGINVDVIMSENAQKFIAPLTFQSLTGNKAVTDMFSTDFQPSIEHISLAKKADVILIAPATANIIAKITYGLADDMLSTVVLASKAKLIIAPAMNTQMYENPVTQQNIEILKKRGVIFIDSVEGLLACNDVGKGKMEEPQKIVEITLHNLFKEYSLSGKKILITAGPTIEDIDPVRFITNRSTGRMGYEIVKEAVRRSAEVTLISGKTNLDIPYGLCEFVPVRSAEDMYREVVARASQNDIVIKSAAVADYRPSILADDKIKKSDDDLKINLERTKDILFEIGKEKRENQFFVGFAAETKEVISNAKNKIKKKNLDMIVANDVKKDGAGFGTQTNIVTIINSKGEVEELSKMTKSEVASTIFDRIIKYTDK